MVGWIGALAKDSERNWTLCKSHDLWGTGSFSGGRVAVGDDFFVWRAGMGWIAHCTATTNGHPPTSRSDVPWPDEERYRFVFGINVETEVFPPLYMSARTLQHQMHLHTIRLGQFPAIQGDALAFLLNEIRDRVS